MRAMALLPLLLVTACGGGGSQTNNTAVAATAEPPERLPAGQWELSSEVTRFTKADSGAPRINTPVGTRATVSVCVGQGDRPPAELFMEAGYNCRFDNDYVRNGRLNATLQCRRGGLDGVVGVSSDGDFTADTLSYNRNVRTILAGDGDVVIDQRVTGRRTGDCAAAASGDAGNSH